MILPTRLSASRCRNTISHVLKSSSKSLPSVNPQKDKTCQTWSTHNKVVIGAEKLYNCHVVPELIFTDKTYLFKLNN
jgi:hypothetical protein